MMILHYSMTEPEHGPASYRVMVPPAGGRVPPPRDCPPTAYGGPGRVNPTRTAGVPACGPGASSWPLP